MTGEELMELYPPWLFPELYPEMFPDYVPPSAPVIDVVGSDPASILEQDPVVIVTSPPEQVSEAPDSVQGTSSVISLDELSQLLNKLQAGDDELDSSEKLPVSEAAIDPGDVVAAELDPATLAIIEAIKYVKEELFQIKDEMTEMQLSMDSHPMLTTPFENYTVTEGLLLLLLLFAFVSACARMLKGGLSWLRS